jgi:hypothetical protein
MTKKAKNATGLSLRGRKVDVGKNISTTPHHIIA